MDLIRNANVLEQEDITILENNNPDTLYNNSPFRNDKGVTRLMLLASFLDKYSKKFHEINSVIKEYIKEVPDEINITSKHGWNVINICIASKYSHIETIKILLNGSANVNHISGYKMTALHIATNYVKLNVAKLILEYDSINIKNKQGTSAVDLLWIDAQQIKFNKILEDITVLNQKN